MIRRIRTKLAFACWDIDFAIWPGELAQPALWRMRLAGVFCTLGNALWPAR